MSHFYAKQGHPTLTPFRVLFIFLVVLFFTILTILCPLKSAQTYKFKSWHLREVNWVSTEGPEVWNEFLKENSNRLRAQSTAQVSTGCRKFGMTPRSRAGTVQWKLAWIVTFFQWFSPYSSTGHFFSKIIQNGVSQPSNHIPHLWNHAFALQQLECNGVYTAPLKCFTAYLSTTWPRFFSR